MCCSEDAQRRAVGVEPAVCHSHVPSWYGALILAFQPHAVLGETHSVAEVIHFSEKRKPGKMHNLSSFPVATLRRYLVPFLLLLRFYCWQPDVQKFLTTAYIHCVFLIGLEKYE